MCCGYKFSDFDSNNFNTLKVSNQQRAASVSTITLSRSAGGIIFGEMSANHRQSRALSNAFAKQMLSRAPMVAAMRVYRYFRKFVFIPSFV